MRKEKIIYNGVEYIVASLKIGEENRLKDVRGAIIAHSENPMIDYEIYDVSTPKENREDLIKILEIYFAKSLGYPMCELDIILDCKKTKLQILNNSQAANAQNNSNCKQIITNCVVLSDLTEILLTTIIYEKQSVRIYECSDTNMCNKELLLRIRIIDGIADADICIIVSVADNVAKYITNTDQAMPIIALRDYFDSTGRKDLISFKRL